AGGLVSLDPNVRPGLVTVRDRSAPDLPGLGRLRPQADREPDVRRHPRAHLPARATCLSGPHTGRVERGVRLVRVFAGTADDRRDCQVVRATHTQRAQPHWYAGSDGEPFGSALRRDRIWASPDRWSIDKIIG